MENNEIMERLLQNDGPASTVKDEVSAKKVSKNGEIPMSRVRVVTAKYKVYIVLLAIFICLLLLIYIPNANDELTSSSSNYHQANSQLDTLKRNIKIAEEDMIYLCDAVTWVVKNEEAMKKCLNERNGCSSLPETWKTGSWEDMHYDLTIPLSYLQLHSLYNKKMPVDEKRVLKNLNEYLIKKDIAWGEKERVWEILKIEIGDPEAVKEWDEHFFQVPVDVEIEFKTVEGLIGFLYNVEKKLIDEWEDRILYKIQSVSYDIVTNDEPQITDISMIAYYYHDEKFNNKKECSDSTESDDNSTNVEETEEVEVENESIFDWIFKKFKK